MRSILTLCLLILSFPLLQAQDFITLQDAGDNVVNGTTVVYYGDAAGGAMEEDIWLTLVSGPSRNINVRRYEISVVPLTQNYFCWGVCYGPRDAGESPVWEAEPQHSLILTAGNTVSNFHAYHSPQGQLGISTYRYVWFDTASPNDTVWVDIEFHATPVGVEEQALSAELSVFPNPSMGGDVRFAIDVQGAPQGMKLVVFNTVGEEVLVSVLRNGQQQVVLPTGELSSGIYFASLRANGNVLTTRRFIVAGR